jgi:uncharacterized protein (UPF0332 family)
VTAGELMAKARQAVLSAKALLDLGDADGATSRAYYAMFDAARAALIANGVELHTSKHGRVIGEFSRRFVKNGPLPRATGRALNDAQVLRTRADYDGPNVAPDAARNIVAEAAEFVDAIDRLLGPPPP